MKRYEIIEILENRFSFFNGEAINLNQVTDEICNLIKNGKNINETNLALVSNHIEIC